MSIEVTVPMLGESITEATLGEWLKKPGDAVKADEPIASLETDMIEIKSRLSSVETKLDALPRVLAEMLDERDKRKKS